MRTFEEIAEEGLETNGITDEDYDLEPAVYREESPTIVDQEALAQGTVEQGYVETGL